MKFARVVADRRNSRRKLLARGSQLNSRDLATDWSGHIGPTVLAVKNRGNGYGVAKVSDLKSYPARSVFDL